MLSATEPAEALFRGFLLLLITLMFATLTTAEIGDALDLSDLQGTWTVEEHSPKNIPMAIPANAIPALPQPGDPNDPEAPPSAENDADGLNLVFRRAPSLADNQAGVLHSANVTGWHTTTTMHAPSHPPPVVPFPGAGGGGGGGTLSGMACDTNTDVTWEISGPVWRRRSSVPDRFNSNGRYYVLGVVRGNDMNFVKFRVFQDLVTEVRPCVGYVRENGKLRMLMNGTNALTCPDKFDEYYGVCNRLVFWTGTFTGRAESHSSPNNPGGDDSNGDSGSGGSTSTSSGSVKQCSFGYLAHFLLILYQIFNQKLRH